MLIGFGYLYKFVMFYFSLFFFFQKAEDNRLKKNPAAQKFVKLFFCFCLN